MRDSVACPYCGQDGCLQTRCHDDGNEYRCGRCGARHSRDAANADTAMPFPGDIYAGLDPNERPLPGRETDTPKCVWCASGICYPVRVRDEFTKYRCSSCRMAHTRKQGESDVFYPFFIDDIERVFT